MNRLNNLAKACASLRVGDASVETLQVASQLLELLVKQGAGIEGLNHGLNSEEIDLLRALRKYDAIKRVSTRVRCSLSNAREIVEKHPEYAAYETELALRDSNESPF